MFNCKFDVMRYAVCDSKCKNNEGTFDVLLNLLDLQQLPVCASFTSK